jgi:hypothetical protein
MPKAQKKTPSFPCARGYVVHYVVIIISLFTYVPSAHHATSRHCHALLPLYAARCSRVARRAGRVAEVRSSWRRVRHLRIGFANTAVALPVALLAVAVAVVCALAAGAATTGGLAGAGCACCVVVSLLLYQTPS